MMFNNLKGKVIPVLVIDDLTKIPAIMDNLKQQKLNVIEVTLRTPQALDAIKLIKQDYSDFILGAGTVLNITQLESAIAAGIDFAVAPGLNPTIAEYAIKKDLPFIPGVATPSEIERAMAMGFSLVKVFPIAALGGVKYLKALAGPYPNIQFMPTGGISEDTAQEYFELKQVICIGGSWMI